jgi:hypothetical protein
MKTHIKVIIAASLATLVDGMTLAGTSVGTRRGPAGRGGEYGHSTRPDRFGSDEHQGRYGWQRRSERFLESFDSHSDGQLTLAEVDQVRRDRLAQFDTDKDGKLTVQEYQALWLGLVLEVIVQRSREMITMAVFARQQAERDLEQGRRARQPYEQ